MADATRDAGVKWLNVAIFDPNIPSIARVYDYMLGGKDNFPSDRELADRMLALMPMYTELARENRQFLARAVTWAANQGISQFIDLGCGMPTAPNTHETAQAITPGARVAYVDNDPVVINHLQARLAKGCPGVGVTDADVRDVATILDAVRASVDLTAPACLLMVGLLHFFPPEAARDLVTRYVAALAPGSYLVLSIGRGDSEAVDSTFDTYAKSAAQGYNHSVADFASFFGPLELVPPGLADARHWHPGILEATSLPVRESQILVGVARTR